MHDEEFTLTVAYELERFQVIAKRLLSLYGARSAVIYLDNNDEIASLITKERLLPMNDYMGYISDCKINQ